MLDAVSFSYLPVVLEIPICSSGDVRVEPRALHVVIKVAAAARVGVL